jgi:DNA-binding winged helix-turn-helix (wHTH) protein
MKQLSARHLPLGQANVSGPSQRHKMHGGDGTAFGFGRTYVLLRERRLLVDGVPVELGARASDLLLALLQADGALVTKDELFDQVWPGIVVSENNLTAQVRALRKALGADRDMIRTHFGRGYRFTGMLRPVEVRAFRETARFQ